MHKTSTASNLSQYEEFGRLNAYYEVKKSAEASGIVKRGSIVLKPGVNFRKGQVLAKIDNSIAIRNLQASKSQFKQTISAILPELKLDLSAEYKKWESYYNQISIHQPLNKLPEYNSQREQNFIGNKGLESTFYSIKANEIQIQKHNIIADFSGTIKEVLVQPGTVVNAGTAIVTILQTDPMEMSVPIPANISQDINLGDSVWVSKGSETFISKVARKATFLNTNNQSRNIYIDLPNQKNNLLDGDYLKASFKINIEKQSVIIPSTAIVRNNKVFIVKKDSTLTLQPVNIISRDDAFVRVNGVSSGLIIVKSPPVSAFEGMKIKYTQE